MKHSRDDYQNSIVDLTGKIPDDEPCFLIRAQDKAGAGAVRSWAQLAEQCGASSEVVRAAMAHADEMEAWPVKKVPDVPTAAELEELPSKLKLFDLSAYMAGPTALSESADTGEIIRSKITDISKVFPMLGAYLPTFFQTLLPEALNLYHQMAVEKDADQAFVDLLDEAANAIADTPLPSKPRASRTELFDSEIKDIRERTSSLFQMIHVPDNVQLDAIYALTVDAINRLSLFASAHGGRKTILKLLNTMVEGLNLYCGEFDKANASTGDGTGTSTGTVPDATGEDAGGTADDHTGDGSGDATEYTADETVESNAPEKTGAQEH